MLDWLRKWRRDKLLVRLARANAELQSEITISNKTNIAYPSSLISKAGEIAAIKERIHQLEIAANPELADIHTKGKTP